MSVYFCCRTSLRSLCVLLPIMGLTWIFGVFSVNEDLVAFQYIFAIFNSLQVRVINFSLAQKQTE